MSSKQLLLLFVIVFMISACQKEPDFTDVPLSVSGCKPAKVYAYDNSGTITDSAWYEYANEKPVKLYLSGDEYTTFTYNGDKISRRSLFETGSTKPYYYQLYSYNPDGKITKIESFNDDVFSGSTKGDSTLLIYSDQKLSSIKTYLEKPSGNGAMVLAYEYLFTYSGNNITKIISKEYENGSVTNEESYLFAYDAKPNYFRKQSPYFLQTDPFFADADYLYFSFALSENNIVKVTDVSSNAAVSTLSYDADSNGNVSVFSVDDEPVLGYTYACK